MTHLLLSFLVPTALANDGILMGTVASVSAGFSDCPGSCTPMDVALHVLYIFRPMLAIVAVLVITITGVRMITSQEDDSLDRLKTVMTGTISGLVMAYLIPPFIAAFYGNAGEVAQGGAAVGVAVLESEIVGLLNWALTLAAVLALLVIILTAAKAVAKYNSDDGVANMRKTVYSVLAGLVILSLKYTLSYIFVASTQNPVPLLFALLTYVSYILGFLGLAAVIVVIYAGFLCLFSFGKEDAYAKAKGILGRAVVGAMVLLVSLAIIRFVVMPFFG